jgi:hypothetical protein
MCLQDKVTSFDSFNRFGDLAVPSFDLTSKVQKARPCFAIDLSKAIMIDPSSAQLAMSTLVGFKVPLHHDSENRRQANVELEQPGNFGSIAVLHLQSESSYRSIFRRYDDRVV